MRMRGVLLQDAQLPQPARLPPLQGLAEPMLRASVEQTLQCSTHSYVLGGEPQGCGRHAGQTYAEPNMTGEKAMQGNASQTLESEQWVYTV